MTSFDIFLSYFDENVELTILLGVGILYNN